MYECQLAVDKKTKYFGLDKDEDMDPREYASKLTKDCDKFSESSDEHRE